MRPENISDALENIDEELLVLADEARENGFNRKNKSKKPMWVSFAACAACLGIIGGTAAVISRKNGGGAAVIKAHAIAEAKYPEAAPYPDESLFFEKGSEAEFDKMYKAWADDRKTRTDAGRAAESPSEFYKNSIQQFLSEAGGKNIVYSPVNLYMALAMLAETTGGSTRNEILSALGAGSIEKLRENAKNIWTANYCNDGAAASVLANSVWLDEGYSYNKPVLETLASEYYASSYKGDLSTEEMAVLFRDWINEQTGGLLKEAADGLEFPENAVMSLCSTVYFRAAWNSKFSKDNNDMKVFHSPGGDRETEFMNRTDMHGPYYWSDDCGAAALHFENGGSMWLILPDEDKTVDDVLESGNYLEMISNYSWENQKSVKVNFSVPKFDVSSDIDLKSGLSSLGVTEVFDFETSDFTPLTNYTALALSGAEHAARVTIDEEGCTAAAYTMLMMAGGTMPPEDEIYFTLDRPFIFVITGPTNMPLFTGVINDPQG